MCSFVGNLDISHLEGGEFGGIECADEFEPTLLIYNQSGQHKGLPMTTLSYPNYTDQIDRLKANMGAENWQIFTAKKFIFLAHGYGDTGTTGWIVRVRKAIFGRNDTDAGVILSLDWSKGAHSLLYFGSAATVRVAGMVLARISDKLVSEGVMQENIWCIGHSLGAQVCAFAGKINRHTYGRITGLDPAKPGFDDKPINYRLNKHFATFVDAIHTGGNKDDIPIINDFGTLVPVGHVDFYPNGGENQPGCSEYANIFKSCSHLRSHDLFIETISHPWCHGGRITDNAKCATTTAAMGYLWNGTQGIFYLVTNGKRPFCRGKDGIRYHDPTVKNPTNCPNVTKSLDSK